MKYASDPAQHIICKNDSEQKSYLWLSISAFSVIKLKSMKIRTSDNLVGKLMVCTITRTIFISDGTMIILSVTLTLKEYSFSIVVNITKF